MLVLVILCSLLQCTQGRVPLSVMLDKEEYIINGNDSNIANHPHQGSLRTRNDNIICGCVLIDPSWAITAAHCVMESGYFTRWGNTNHKDGIRIKIGSVARHPDFNEGPGAFPNDIAVLSLVEPATGTNISPIDMGSTHIEGGINGTITGWGSTCASCPLPDILQELTIPVISDVECVNAWGENYSPVAHICVFGNNGGACNADSGGPLTINGELHGLASWVASGCDKSYPSVYVRVTTYREWVCQQTGGAGC